MNQTLAEEVQDLKELRNALDAELAKLITLKRDTWATLNAQIERLEPHPLDDLISALRFQWDALSYAKQLDVDGLRRRGELMVVVARMADLLGVAYPEMGESAGRQGSDGSGGKSRD